MDTGGHHVLFLRRCGVVAVVIALTGVVMVGSAAAAPSVSTTGASPGAGAIAVDASISAPPAETFPAAPKSPTGCTFPNVVGPGGLVIKHVAPCQTGAGNGTAASPWRTIASAMANLTPGEVAYLHDGPAAVDYTESNLTPAKDGTGPSGRMRLMAAPGERPWTGKSPTATTAQPILRLTRPWWLVDGLNIDAAGQPLGAAVIRVGPGPAAHHIVLRHMSSRNASVPKSIVEFDGAQNAALLDSIGSTATGPIGLLEPLDANGRPRNPPPTGSGTYTDHHAITAINGADRILVRNNESAGHNGDSFQCGEEADATRPVTSNITLESNRFHQDEENAVDLKACHGVTVRGNKFFGYRPARPYNTDGTLGTRAPQGDALVVHQALNAGGTPGRAADRVLVELNRFWDNSRSINVASRVNTAVLRRNLIFDASTASCGMGAGIALGARTAEVYHNTLDTLRPLAVVRCGDPWSPSDKYALRINPTATTGARVTVWNNIVSNATNTYTQSGTFTLDATSNLFPQATAGLPPGSVFGDPLYVPDPRSNDYFTQRGSPARDTAAAVPAAVADPRTYCDDPSPGETDTNPEPDIGFLESCT